MAWCFVPFGVCVFAFIGWGLRWIHTMEFVFRRNIIIIIIAIIMWIQSPTMMLPAISDGPVSHVHARKVWQWCGCCHESWEQHDMCVCVAASHQIRTLKNCPPFVCFENISISGFQVEGVAKKLRNLFYVVSERARVLTEIDRSSGQFVLFSSFLFPCIRKTARSKWWI